MEGGVVYSVSLEIVLDSQATSTSRPLLTRHHPLQRLGSGVLAYRAFPVLCFSRVISSSTSCCVRTPLRSNTATNAAIS
jgi:hypothetical protein